jgi:hypothetical protein
MKRADFVEQLEERRLRTAAREYAQQGYRVIRHPAQVERPEFLAAFEPDMIAYGTPENVVVEVRSRDTLAGAKELVALTAAVNAQAGWRIDLIVTNPLKLAIVQKGSVILAQGEAQERVMGARQLLTLEQIEAAFVLAWSAIEAQLRRFGDSGPIPVDYVGETSLLGDAYSIGMIALDDYEILRDALEQRNALVHGYGVPDDLASLTARVIEIAERLLAVDVAALAS